MFILNIFSMKSFHFLEFFAIRDSTQLSVRPVGLSAGDGKATFSKELQTRQPSPTQPINSAARNSPTQPSSPGSGHHSPHYHCLTSPSPSPSPPQRSSPQTLGSSSPIPVPSPARLSSLSQQLRERSPGNSPVHVKRRSEPVDLHQVCNHSYRCVCVFL